MRESRYTERALERDAIKEGKKVCEKMKVIFVDLISLKCHYNCPILPLPDSRDGQQNKTAMIDLKLASVERH